MESIEIKKKKRKKKKFHDIAELFLQLQEIYNVTFIKIGKEQYSNKRLFVIGGSGPFVN